MVGHHSLPVHGVTMQVMYGERFHAWVGVVLEASLGVGVAMGALWPLLLLPSK